MKILIFLPYLIGGGAQRVVINLLHGLDKEKFDLKLVVIDKEGPFLAKIPEEVELIELNGNRVLTSILELRKVIRNIKPDIVFSHLSYANIAAVIAAMISGVETKIIVVEHNNYLASRRRGFKKEVFSSLLKMMYRCSNKIVTVSDGVAESLKQIGLKGEAYTYKTIYNPIVNENILNKKDKTIKYQWINDQKIKVVLGVGRLSKQKDFSTLIKAFSIARKANQNIKLIILGEGDRRENLIKLIKNLNLEKDVDLAGFVDNPFTYMSRADVFVLSSRWEGFGNVIVEAMACGCPVISTDCPYGPGEIITDSENGLLVPVGDMKEMAEKMNLVLKDNDLRKKLSMNGKKRAERFKISKIAEDYEKLFWSLYNSVEK